MDPSRNRALLNGKLHTLPTLQQQTTRTTSDGSPPPPPAYQTVVDPTAPIPNMYNPYDPDDEEEGADDNTPEVTINAQTQIRGHGNIISPPHMDSAQIAHLVTSTINGIASGEADPASGVRPARQSSKVRITVNCGATVIGDRNIVSLNIGEAARHFQAQTQAQAQRSNQQSSAAAQGHAPVMTPPQSRQLSANPEPGSEGSAKRKAAGEADGSPDEKKSC
ncbi:hypothetical protein BDV95DRAFT_596075 [Massariosphaeria phaeospora]|uniref:Uncharacterized protein n=1 Tax=Massariosphaeria phaeospora TaxID=100035 RepID=A0A7C8M459_9PLEO|nr:hypothetical protein BDV95DRAFT_596075 [Massariosphaeria phaeospora]